MSLIISFIFSSVTSKSNKVVFSDVNLIDTPTEVNTREVMFIQGNFYDKNTTVDLLERNVSADTGGGKLIDPTNQVTTLATNVLSIAFYLNIMNWFDQFLFGGVNYIMQVIEIIGADGVSWTGWLSATLKSILMFMYSMAIINLFTNRDLFNG